jgi:hypothetical protein
MRSHNGSQLFAYVKSNSGSSFLFMVYYFIFTPYFCLLQQSENVDTPGEAQCVWRVLLRANQTLSLNVIFERNIEGLLK